MHTNNFTLWLEWEEYATNQQIDLDNDYCNIALKLSNGQEYFLNVWTYQFFAQAIQENQQHQENLHGLYLEPPDLFVKSLDRKTIEKIMGDLIKKGYFQNKTKQTKINLTRS